MTTPGPTWTQRLGVLLGAAAVVGAIVSCGVPGLPPLDHFALTGRHAELGCGDCHATSLRDPVPDTCIGCHLDDRPPDHPDGDCGTCHTPSGWGDVRVDHDFFPLLHGHGGLACSDCHAPGTYLGLSPQCASCHEVDRPADHFAGGCESCHDITSWDDASFDHAPYLSLAGGHAPLACTDCHAPDTYEGFDRACGSCHEVDRPVGHFAGDCAGCHDVSGWDDATFDHRRFFPLPHRGVSQCASCHPDASSYEVFTCTDCHAHRQAAMDGEHRGMSRYVYASSACLSCHPRGSE